tara:strand:+ start:3365 stop:4522 length:1158 start_codon:yes stop_codon:yes gene_type:complete
MKILINCNYYFPGNKSGGNLISVNNLIEETSSYHNYYLITRDRDLGDIEPYKGIAKNQWIEKEFYKVKYISKKKQTFLNFKNIINKNNYDLIYLNSFFDLFSIKILILNKLRLIKKIPILLCSKGELSENSLKIKSFKKKVFFLIFKNFINLYSNIYFLASTKNEYMEIVKHKFKNIKQIYVAQDIFIKKKIKYENAIKFDSKKILKLCYVSRITPKKNLLKLLYFLSEIKINYCLDIYGHIDDKNYFDKCKKIIKKINTNSKKISYLGVLNHDKVVEKLNMYHLFILLTKNENFGHIISESFNAGTPVLLSNETIWNNLQKLKIGWNININNSKEFNAVLDYLYKCSDNDYINIRKNIFKYFNDLIVDDSIKQNLKVLEKIKAN